MKSAAPTRLPQGYGGGHILPRRQRPHRHTSAWGLSRARYATDPPTPRPSGCPHSPAGRGAPPQRLAQLAPRHADSGAASGRPGPVGGYSAAAPPPAPPHPRGWAPQPGSPTRAGAAPPPAAPVLARPFHERAPPPPLRRAAARQEAPNAPASAADVRPPPAAVVAEERKKRGWRLGPAAVAGGWKAPPPPPPRERAAAAAVGAPACRRGGGSSPRGAEHPLPDGGCRKERGAKGAGSPRGRAPPPSGWGWWPTGCRGG